MSMCQITLAPGNLCILFTWRKVTSARRVTRCCTTGNPPLRVHVNSYRCQTVHRGKVDPRVSELPWGNELSRDHVNWPLVSRLLCNDLLLAISFPVLIFESKCDKSLFIKANHLCLGPSNV